MGNKKHLSLIFLGLFVVAGLLAVFYYFGKLTPSALTPGSFETLVAHRGEVLLSTRANGVVESENEVIVLSPATSIIKSILKEPGDYVEKGETIVQLNTETVEETIERLLDQLEMKRNNLEKTRLNAKSAKLDLDYNEEVKRLRITSLQSQLADQKQLLEVGGISPARVEQTRQEITLAEKDHAMLIEKNAIRLKQLEADEAGLLMQIRMDEKVLKTNQELLAKMDIKAPSSGIILNISGHVGEKINADRTVVHMSDLTSFKIIGSIDEQLANQVKTGKKVLLTLDNERLEGVIGSITPIVENSKVQFNVHLKQSSHPKLIANQTVVIQIVNGLKENVLRIKKLPDFEKGSTQKVFVVSGNTAVKREIELGLAGDEYVEVKAGLEEGDAIVSEGPAQLNNVNEIEIKN